MAITLYLHSYSLVYFILYHGVFVSLRHCSSGIMVGVENRVPCWGQDWVVKIDGGGGDWGGGWLAVVVFPVADFMVPRLLVHCSKREVQLI